ncbi:hypothetical protein PUN28_012606 [Cardiocondyla obscurior]|uniref:Uncharacterized protein n=1 Tax=Cardiocondyla obscurior TaxID=286306 RepID=A0AAW2FHL7_9HYME
MTRTTESPTSEGSRGQTDSRLFSTRAARGPEKASAFKNNQASCAIENNRGRKMEGRQAGEIYCSGREVPRNNDDESGADLTRRANTTAEWKRTQYARIVLLPPMGYGGNASSTPVAVRGNV